MVGEDKNEPSDPITFNAKCVLLQRSAPIKPCRSLDWDNLKTPIMSYERKKSTPRLKEITGEETGKEYHIVGKDGRRRK